MYLPTLADEGLRTEMSFPRIVPIYYSDGRLCVRVVFLYFFDKHNELITGNDFQVDGRRGCTHFMEVQGHRVILLKGNKAGTGWGGWRGCTLAPCHRNLY